MTSHQEQSQQVPFGVGVNMIYGVVYKITNLINKKAYIGQTKRSIKERLNGHFYPGNGSKNTKLYKAICKYGKENFIVETIDTACSLDELNKKEIYYISLLKSIDYGYNTRPGGACTEKTPSKEETKKKISAATSGKNNPMYGTKMSDSHKEKLRKINTGKKASEKTRKLLSEIHKGKVFSKDHLDAVAKINSKPIIGINIKTRDIIEFEKIQMVKEIGLDPSAVVKVCSGVRWQHGGYMWKYKTT